MKKSWEKPELTVIVRSNPEEAVLNTCKTATQVGGAMPENGNCTQMFCGDCATLIGS